MKKLLFVLCVLPLFWACGREFNIENTSWKMDTEKPLVLNFYDNGNFKLIYVGSNLVIGGTYFYDKKTKKVSFIQNDGAKMTGGYKEKDVLYGEHILLHIDDRYDFPLKRVK